MNILTDAVSTLVSGDGYLYTNSDVAIAFLLAGLTLYAGYRLYKLIKNFKHE